MRLGQKGCRRRRSALCRRPLKRVVTVIRRCAKAPPPGCRDAWRKRGRPGAGILARSKRDRLSGARAEPEMRRSSVTAAPQRRQSGAQGAPEEPPSSAAASRALAGAVRGGAPEDAGAPPPGGGRHGGAANPAIERRGAVARAMRRCHPAAARRLLQRRWGRSDARSVPWRAPCGVMAHLQTRPRVERRRGGDVSPGLGSLRIPGCHEDWVANRPIVNETDDKEPEQETSDGARARARHARL